MNYSDLFFEAKRNYELKRWSKSMLKMLVANSKITADEFKEITGEKYEEN